MIPEEEPEDFLFRVHPICERFEARLRTGRRPPIGPFLAGVDGPDRHRLFALLLELEVDYRRRAGETLPARRLLEEFPEYGVLIAETVPEAGPAVDRGVEAPRPLDRIGPYRILRELGRGGMGIVYAAAQDGVSRPVALKVLRPEAAGSARARERFLREARAVGRLHHTHIVPVFAAGEMGGVAWCAMQLIEGISLDRLLSGLRAATSEAAGPVARWRARLHDDRRGHRRAVAEIGAAVAGALAHAHARGVLHRDVKPGNLLLDAEDRPWLVDFGLARLEADDLTLPGGVIGTLRYLPPEGFDGRWGPATDIYALGLTLRELLTLEPVFPQEDPATLGGAIARGESAPLRRGDPRIPRNLELILDHAIARDPRDRHPNAAALAEDLQRWLDGRPPTIRRASVWQRAVRWGAREPALASSLGGLVLALLVGVLLAGSHARTLAVQSARNEDLARRESTARATAERARRKMAEQLYASTLLGGSAALSRPRAAARLHEALAELPASARNPALRGFEWDFLESWASDATKVHRLREIGCTVSWTSDGERLFCGTPRSIEVIAAGSGELVSLLRDGGPIGHHFPRLGPEGRHVRHREGRPRLFAGVEDDQGVPLEGADGEAARSWFTPDGTRLLLTNHEARALVYDARTGRFLSGHPHVRHEFATDPGWRRVATLAPARQGVSIRSLESDEEIAFVPVTAKRILWGPDDESLLLGTEDGEIVRWDLEKEREVWRVPLHQSFVSTLSLSSDREWVATGGKDGIVGLLRVDGGETRRLQGHARIVSQVAWHPRELLLASVSADATARIWDPRRPRTLSVTDLSWDAAFRERMRRRQTMRPPLLAFTEGGEGVWSAWRYRTWRRRPDGRIEAEQKAGFSGPSGRRLLDDGGSLLLRDREGERRLGPSIEAGDLLAWGPEARWAALLLTDERVALVDTEGRIPPRIVPGGRPASAAFDPEGRHVAVFDYFGIVVYALPELREVARLEDPDAGFHALAFHPDGRRIALGTRHPQALIWDRESGEVMRWSGHSGRVWAVEWSPDGRRLATGGRDGTLRLFDARTGLDVFALDLGEEVIRVAFREDGRALAALTEGGEVHLLRTDERATPSGMR